MIYLSLVKFSLGFVINLPSNYLACLTHSKVHQQQEHYEAQTINIYIHNN